VFGGRRMKITLCPIDYDISIGELQDLYTYLHAEFGVDDISFDFGSGEITTAIHDHYKERFIREWTLTPHVRLFPIIINNQFGVLKA
jgi:hypothetical protein